MPATKNAMTRYKILDELLSDSYHDFSLDELTEKVSDRLAEIDSKSGGVVRRTIEKDIQYLEKESTFSVEIERYSTVDYNKEKQKHEAKRCLRYANPGFSIFKKEMSDDEKYLLSEALSLLGQFEGLPNLDALEEFRKSLGVRNEEQQIISFTKNPLEDSSLLGELFTCISNHQVIEIHYHKFNDPETSLAINLHPYLLKEYNRRWFLFAAAETDEKLLCFGLDRIDQVKPLPSHTYHPFEGNINDLFEDIIGVTYYADKEAEPILFWVSDSAKDYVRTKPLHDSQITYHGEKDESYRNEFPQLTGGAFFSIECIENYELIRELCSFGSDLIVLSPVSIQNKVFERCVKMAEMYKEIRK